MNECITGAFFIHSTTYDALIQFECRSWMTGEDQKIK